MRRVLFICCLCTLIGFKVAAQSVTFTLPDSLNDKPNTIVLNDITVFTIEDIEKSTLYREYDLIIRNKYSDSRTEILLHYDKFTSINFINVEQYDVRGKVKEKYKSKDFNDFSATGSSVADDSRGKYLKITSNTYPYRLKISYETTSKGSLFYPTWMPHKDGDEYIKESSFNIINKTGIPFRYKNINISEPEIKKNSGEEIYIWTVKDLLPVEFEKYNYNIEDYFTLVQTGPTQFSMDGYKGDMSSWEMFGKWINQLNDGKDNLSPEQLKEVISLIDPADSDLQKTRKVYEYLQNKTRYVSIQLGIGGWQPFDASFVHDRSYGDCKALSFYTKTLLKAVGVDSYYTLIRAGTYKPEINDDFPVASFNHAILTVPMEKDTIWLECTSQTNPFGYMGYFTSDRKALLIDETGGKVIRTKAYTEAENLQLTKAEVILDKTGSAKASVNRLYTGLETENDNFNSMLLKTKEEQDKWFIDELAWGNFSVDSYDLREFVTDVVPAGGFTTEINIKSMAVNSANRLFVKPAHFTDISFFDVKKSGRIEDVIIKYPYTQIDTVFYRFPDAYHIEKSLEDVEMKTDFGTYNRKIEVNPDGFYYIRKFIIRKGKYAPEQYSSFREFILDVQKYDRQKIVLVGST
ncbi:MAG: DUF3857 domain-containing protein [Candidatus Cyclobacteriaceae bacterium M2_1C_046]